MSRKDPPQPAARGPLARLVPATRHSLHGLQAAWSEAAFRHETLAALLARLT